MMFDQIKEELNQKLTEAKRDRDNLAQQQKDLETRLQFIQGRIEALEEAIACLPEKLSSQFPTTINLGNIAHMEDPKHFIK